MTRIKSYRVNERAMGRARRWARVMGVGLAGLLPQAAHAGLSLSGGNLALVQEGPVANKAGDPVPPNLATNATPFASGELGPELGIGFHVIDNLNDGFYGNAYSWIGGAPNEYPEPFAGIDFGATAKANIQSLAFGRSNVLGGDACGVCVDRHQGLYTLQYTRVPNPSSRLDLDATGNASTGWVSIGTLEYGPSDGPGTNYNQTWIRHRYNFDPVSATGLRLIVPATGLGGGTAIDEIEVFDAPGVFVPPPPPPAPVVLTPSAGFSLTWDGNNGANFTGDDPAQAPDNLALASRGSVAFSSSDLGPQLSIPFHVADNLNDGLYGNANSWIGGDDNPFAPVAFAGVRLAKPTAIGRVAWGRDNGNNTTDACGGQCTDRSTGTFTLQFTSVANPDANTAETGNASTGWQTLGTADYRVSDATFTTYLRHEYAVSSANGGILASGFRLLVPATGLASGTAIDEIELYAAGLAGDLDNNGVVDANDIDLMASAIRSGSTAAQYDLNQDKTVNSADHRYMVQVIKKTWFGDANLDGVFNTTDFVSVFQRGEYEDGVPANSGWSDGDWNGDADFNTADFVIAFQDGGFEQGPRAAVSAVPEPTGLALFALGLLSQLGRIRCRNSPSLERRKA